MRFNVGDKFSKLTLVERFKGKSKAKFRCECGNYTIKNIYAVERLATKSCGCLPIPFYSEKKLELFGEFVQNNVRFNILNQEDRRLLNIEKLVSDFKKTL